MRIAILHSRLRTEERLLVDAFTAKGIDAHLLDARELVLNPADADGLDGFDVVLDRCVSLTCSLNAVRILEHHGVRCMNPCRAIEVCSDKLRTTLALIAAGVPTPAVRVALGPESALRAVEQLGYPCVLKPTVGSWGRMVSRANDRDAAEAIIEHRETLGSPAHHVHYAQEHIDKPGRDIRVFVVGGRVIAAITRSSGHWVTNTARGASAAGFSPPPELAAMCTRAAEAVGADAVAVDVLECPRRGFLINELNHSMEFRNSIDVSGVDIPAFIVRHTLDIASSRTSVGSHS